MRQLAAVLFLIAVYTGTGCAAARASISVPEGTWIIADRVALQLFDCDRLLCGRVVWLRNPALRTEAMCGRTIVWGLKMTDPGEWSGGWFFDPEDETTYNVSAQMQGDDRMTARIYKAVSWLGRTEILTRIRSDGRPGWCSVR
jgi:uncharacterized protein (DUF2147 family)